MSNAAERPGKDQTTCKGLCNVGFMWVAFEEHFRGGNESDSWIGMGGEMWKVGKCRQREGERDQELEQNVEERLREA